ncbi:hypothetical protein F2P81_006754 [Scophthalmus maximus]|uniref:Uncharacterized protein n=1 Tax=Scophthalmus maximus TaxID=52904 RepID=A0A6A4T047_SCOMX|nr:hypothetical protein F2P81_006754 [Scophthalmus maximus]
MPSAIRAMAFNPRTERLAVARADGAVEIFNFADNYFQEKVIPGRDGGTVEALCWVGPRLFGAGLNGAITEYDLENLRPRYSVEAYGGPIWTVSGDSAGTMLAVGCEDGTVKMFEILDETIRFQRNLERQKGRIISLSWQPSGALIAAGMIDMIRIFNAETGRATHRLLVERGAGASKSREVVVWSVVFLSDHTIVSGDSAGKVQFWDGHTGTLVRTHLVTKWDVLALAVSQDESSVVAGTSESIVVQFQFISSTVGRQDNEWVRTRTFKNHSHDVRALVHTETAVVSGGMDTQLVVRPLLDKVEKNTQESSLRKIAFPHGDDHIRCSAVSPCGGWLVYATVSGVRLYRIQHDNNNIGVTKVSKLPKSLCSAHQLCFSSDSSKLFAASGLSSVVVVALNPLECKHLHTLRPKSVPVYSSCPTAIGINPVTSNLVTVHADQQVFEFSLQQKEYTEWSRRLQQRGLHPVWLQRDTPVAHITFNPRNPAHIVLHDVFMLCIIDQSLHLLSMTLLDDQSLVAVERPLLDIVSQLPAPVRQKKFAT